MILLSIQKRKEKKSERCPSVRQRDGKRNDLTALKSHIDHVTGSGISPSGFKQNAAHPSLYLRRLLREHTKTLDIGRYRIQYTRGAERADMQSYGLWVQGDRG